MENYFEKTQAAPASQAYIEKIRRMKGNSNGVNFNSYVATQVYLKEHEQKIECIHLETEIYGSFGGFSTASQARLELDLGEARLGEAVKQPQLENSQISCPGWACHVWPCLSLTRQIIGRC